MLGGKIMDNFMDKLAHKFSAQDIIKANSAAEEKELRRLQMQIEEYDNRLQEMRKLNLKNMELAEKASTVLDESIEKVKSIQNSDVLVESLKDMEHALSENKMNVEELIKQIDESVHKECVKVYRNVEAVLTEELKSQKEELLAFGEKGTKKVKGIKPLLWIGLVLMLANLGVQIASILGVF